ncbi:UvrD/REP helicase N-terminal domain-containing protein [Paraburkholderia diazotrophica]|uniref:UvrD/REP helicase N-terminal domain-containing protein n=1 Tax=Paraburkholderia diazotrophica TaxID=667676 RepID=A0A1H7EGH4_9BURK|nr:UvrD/REP helicase N-terminal domain-containing protein [Paraburkholderia diazotrophica]
MLDELNPQQREVAQLRQNCVAIACPGAGKTKTIATKAALLLQDSAAVVGAVTFSKDAAVWRQLPLPVATTRFAGFRRPNC